MTGVTNRKEQLKVNVNIGGQAVKQIKLLRYFVSLVNKVDRFFER